MPPLVDAVRECIGHSKEVVQGKMNQDDVVRILSSGLLSVQAIVALVVSIGRRGARR